MDFRQAGSDQCRGEGNVVIDLNVSVGVSLYTNAFK
jgi:hypothetical protein